MMYPIPNITKLIQISPPTKETVRTTNNLKCMKSKTILEK